MTSAIGWNNEVTNGYSAAPSLVHNMTSASVDSARPLLNFINPDPAKVARVTFANSTGGSAAVIFRKQMSAANDKNFRTVAALNLRLPAGNWSTLALALFTVDLITGANYIISTPSTVVPIPGTTDRYNLFASIPGGVTGRAFIDLTIITATGTSGYIDLGHLWASDGLELEEDWGSGWDWYAVDNSLVTAQPNNFWSTYSYDKTHGLMLSKKMWSKAQAFGTSASPTAPSMRRLLLEAGTSKPVLAVLGQDEHERQMFSKYGLLRSPLPTLTNRPGKRWDDNGLRIY